MRVLTDHEILVNIKAHRVKTPLAAKVFYSSWLGGITTNPDFVSLPLDDHMAHRGDAVFEAMRFGHGGIYLWTPHWERLNRSAAKVGIKLPHTEEEVLSLLKTMVKESGLGEGLIRMYLSRGPGSFGVNPYDCPEAGFYVVLSSLSLPPKEKYETGVSLCLARIEAKQGWMAQVKSCNYLINVLVKKEAMDRGFDYGVVQTSFGEITESSTENLLVFTRNGELLFPTWENTLQGTTLVRVMEFCSAVQVDGRNLRPVQRSLNVEDLRQARELMLVGTTLGVLPVSRFEEQTWSDFTGARALHQALEEDLRLSVARKVSAAL